MQSFLGSKTMRIAALLAATGSWPATGQDRAAPTRPPAEILLPPTTPAVATEPSGAAAETDRLIADLMGRLGDDWYPERERAQRELMRLGHAAYDALIEGERHADPEVASQARYLLRILRANWVREDDPPEVRSLLSDYEARSVALRLQRVRELAELAGDAGLPALCRLIKYEPAELVSKTAALAVLGGDADPTQAERRARRDELLERHLARSSRQGAAWVKLQVQSHRDPPGAVAGWQTFIARERQLLSELSDQTHARIVAELVRNQVALFDQLAQTSEADASLAKMLEVDLNDSELLVDTVSYFTRRKAWALLDRLETQAAEPLATDALALYQLAEARQLQGDEPRALATAEKAVKVSARRTTDHVQMASTLLDRGLLRWADYEFTYVLEHDKPGTVASLWAATRYSELLHDRGLHRQAGEVRQRIVDAVENDPDHPTLQALSQLESTVEEFRSRMHYFFSCDYAARNDAEHRLDELKKAIAIHDTDEDVLIALFHLPPESDADRQVIRESLNKAVEKNRELIRKEPEESMGYNQLAWLVANTEGDFDEAIKLAQRAIQLRRDEAARLGVPARVGGYYDTLAHCYAAKKDYANAVKSQLEATQLDPHSRQIADKLALFRQRLADQLSLAAPAVGK